MLGGQFNVLERDGETFSLNQPSRFFGVPDSLLEKLAQVGLATRDQPP